jgi:hypothetical protein
MPRPSEGQCTGSDDGLGDSTATPPGKRGRANAKDGAEHEGALPPLVDA